MSKLSPSKHFKGEFPRCCRPGCRSPAPTSRCTWPRLCTGRRGAASSSPPASCRGRCSCSTQWPGERAGIGHVTACSALIGPAAHVSACSAVIGPCPGCGGTTGPAPRRATRWSTLAGSGRRSWSTLKIVIFNKSFYNFFVKYFEEKIIEQQIWAFLKYLVTKTLIYKYSLSCLFKQKWSNFLNLHHLLCSIKSCG